MDQQSWRNKYLTSLEEQEALEKRVQAQSELLRRLVMYSTSAMEGMDADLENALFGLREKIRGASGAVVHDYVVRLESLVKQFEQRRADYHLSSVASLDAVLAQLLVLDIPGEVRGELKEFRKRLEKSSFNLAKFPSYMTSFAKVHQKAIGGASEREKGLWQRLRGGTTLRPEKVIDAVEDEKSAVEKPRQNQEREIGKAEESVSENSDHIFESSLDKAGWDVVDEEISQVLAEILEAFSENEKASEKWQSAKLRLQQGMDWHQLVDTLEDFRELLIARDEPKDSSFSEYLTQVNEELHEICERLGLSVEAEQQHELAINALGKEVTGRMEEMQTLVANSEDLEGLKHNISQHIDAIGSALDEFKEKNSEERPISEELKALIDKVKTIEAESERTRQLLAQEQYRANHDALTELPNREAYNNRVYLEWQRYKRYGRPLCIAVCDIDHFKRFNDDFGHQIGDRVLRLIAKSLVKRLRTVDFVARYGGEEFVILLPETALEDAVNVLEDARKIISEGSFRLGDEPVRITFSCGVTSFSKEDSTATAFARADDALYKAKENGRNQTIKIDQS